jgi:hypothetical protein
MTVVMMVMVVLGRSRRTGARSRVVRVDRPISEHSRSISAANGAERSGGSTSAIIEVVNIEKGFARHTAALILIIVLAFFLSYRLN